MMEKDRCLSITQQKNPIEFKDIGPISILSRF